MSAFDPPMRWRQEPTVADEMRFRGGKKAWLASLVIHVLVLVILASIRNTEPIQGDHLTLTFSKELDAEELDVSVEMVVSDKRMSDIGVPSAGVVEQSAPQPIGHIPSVPDPIEATETPLELSSDAALAELFSNGSAALLKESAGLSGAVVNARGDLGSVERITLEILGQLEQGEVLVAWLMDASESLRPRREQIIKHFDRVYDELGALADERGDSLLTSIAAFGKETLLVTPKPTANRDEIRKAVREIIVDESGVENVFGAIKWTARTYQKFARAGRKVMIVVLTDEMGNDLSELDEAAALVARHRMPVYVLGPIAPFGRQRVKVKWTDEASGEAFFLPVDRGPETAQIEHAILALWQDGPGSILRSSGFGPYGLTRITRQSGGLCLLSDDGNIPDPSFNVQALWAYGPDYVSPAEYAKLAAESPLRTAVLRTSQTSNGLLTKRLPTRFLAAGIQFEIRDVGETLATTVDVLNRGLNELRGAEKFRVKEKSLRWQAHYDLLLGRLLANKVRCQCYTQLLEEMYVNPKAPRDGTKNAWGLVGDDDTAPAHAARRPTTNVQDASAARAYLERVIDEHPSTPWAAIAESELAFPLEFQWRETFMNPPKGAKLPWDKVPWDQLSEAQKVAKVNFEKQQRQKQKRRQVRTPKHSEARKRIPNL